MINVSPTTTDRKSETEREKFSLFIFILILIVYHVGCFKKRFRFDGISSRSIHDPGFL